MSSATLLVELFTEELPPKSLRKLGESFSKSIFESIRAQGLASDDSGATMFASPRRLATSITRVNAVGTDKRVRQKLMPTKVAFAGDGKPSAALIKRLEKEGYASGVMPDADLTRVVEGGVEYLYLDQMNPGQTLPFALLNAVKRAIDELPVAKVMSYQLADGVTTVQFVRPTHGLVALHGAEIIPVHALGLTAGRTTHGHRFQGAADIELKDANEYEARLENEGGVIASFDKRRAEIMRLLFAHAEQAGDTLGEPADYTALLDEVTGLVERPTVYVGRFDAEFLEVPPECLVLTMKLNQKYFPLYLSEGGLSSRFLIVSNMRLDDPRNVIEGNERVVRPRLADARFFFETDKKTRLADRIPKLASVVYHNKLGSQFDRMNRVRLIAGQIADRLQLDRNLCERAAYLSKADLVSDMVGEFPELQGIMGGYYARHDGENEDVVSAIATQYTRRERNAEPSNLIGEVLVIADRAETLVGIWGIGLKPTGDKDPFALRRAALAIIRAFELLELDSVVGETPRRRLDLTWLLSRTQETFGELVKAENVVSELRDFIYERYWNQLAPLYGLSTVGAVIELRPPLEEVGKRVLAVREFQKLPEADSLAAANKRIGNILKKSEQLNANIDSTAFIAPAERALFDAVQSGRPAFDRFYEAGDYTNALKSLAPLKEPVDAFFDAVMVNVEDTKLRENRLALLGDLHALMNKVADLSKLAA